MLVIKLKSRFFVTIILLSNFTYLAAQGISKRVLFLGNSYTYVNNLPQLIASAATSTGDTLYFDSNTIGGFTLQGHASDATSLGKIASGNWDYVVLQEQSQLPSFEISQVESEVFPYARFLDSAIVANNPCAETVFYMTWGRKNGDASNCTLWPPVCTYQGMDSLLNLRYTMMADSNNAILSPVGAVWHYIRHNFPSIELYSADESHPSLAGSYAAACCFYTALFRKDPTLISFNSSLNTNDAANIRIAAKIIVYDSLYKWNIGKYDPLANFTYSTTANNQISFNNASIYSSDYNWNFGDGTYSLDTNPVHNYSTAGTYYISLISGNCGIHDTTSTWINVSTTSINPGFYEKNDSIKIFPNPANAELTISTDRFCNSNYRIYNSFGAIVIFGKCEQFPTYVDITTLSKGFYILELFTETGKNIRFKFEKN